ncbi:MAG: hypothetical protein H6822_21795 [Planctomycetaceae bacterium]|nr:hypothetical protein [Planctomycetales bacterium]MCB9924830.1 hypothetical protein [Planctomycetaceae bacterium]
MGILDKFFGPPSKKQFAKALIGGLRRIGDTGTIIYDAENFRLLRTDREHVTNLSNIYQEHCSLPRSERRSHLLRLVHSLLIDHESIPDDFSQARSNLRPKIWLRSMFVNMELEAKLKGSKAIDLPLYPIGEHLYSSLVYDLPTSMASISHETLENWGVSYYEAMECACQNLDESTIAWGKIGDNFHSAVSGDNYDSSRVLLLDRIRSFDVIGNPVAMVAQRDAMYVTGSDDESGLGIMLALTEKTLAEEPRPLSPLPMQLVEGEWVDWMPERDHPLYPKFALLETNFLGGLYAEQKELLNAVNEQTSEDDAFVASFSGLQNDAGDVKSYCVWGAGVHTLLPKTQYIMLSTENGLVASGKWDTVQRHVGDLMRPAKGLYPIRYRVREFPSQQQLADIGKVDL